MSAINNNQPPSNAAPIESTAMDKTSTGFGGKIARVLNSDAMAATCVGLGGILTLVGLALLFLASGPTFLPVIGAFAVAFGLFLLLNGAVNFFANACEKASESSQQKTEYWVNPYDAEGMNEPKPEDAKGDDKKDETQPKSLYRGFQQPEPGSPSPPLGQSLRFPPPTGPKPKSGGSNGLYKPMTGDGGEPFGSNNQAVSKKK